jgi:hypothetical protein
VVDILWDGGLEDRGSEGGGETIEDSIIFVDAGLASP